MFFKQIQLVVGLACVMMFSACSFAPEYVRPDQEIAKEWKAIDDATQKVDSVWWKTFKDPVLDALIDEALINNQDIAQAVANLASAEAQAMASMDNFIPNANITGEHLAQSASTVTPNAPRYNSITGPYRANTSYNFSLGAAWELDFWGKYRNTYSALTDIMFSTSASLAATRLLVAGQTAQAYFNLRAYDMQLATAMRTLKTREKGLFIYEERLKQGEITELDYLRAKNEVDVAQAQINITMIGVDEYEATLAVLAGRSPRVIMNDEMERGNRLYAMPFMPILPAGLPSELLNRRPDIVSAEYSLRAFNANIGIAKAAYFPSISLTGSLGSLSSSFSDIFSGPAGAWSYGVNATVPILDYGRIWYTVKDAEAKKAAAVAIYNKTVQVAFKDIRVALTRQREASIIVDSYQSQVDNMTKVTELAQLQYENGYVDYLNLLDAERILFSAELALASAMRDRLNAIVSVCMALGGGWSEKK